MTVASIEAVAVHPDPNRSPLRRLLPLLTRHRFGLVVSLVTALAMQLLSVTTPRVLMTAVDHALVERRDDVEPYVYQLAALALAIGISAYLHRAYLFRTGALMQRDLRVLIFDRLSYQSAAYFDRSQTGQLVSRANSDIRAVEMLLMFAPALAILFLGVFIAIALMASISISLTAVAVLPLPFVVLSGVHMRKVGFPLAWLVQARTGDVSTVVEENIAGTRVVKAFAAEPSQLARLNRAAVRLRWASVRELSVRARYQPLIMTLPRLGMAGVLMYGGHLAIDGHISVGALIAFNAYLAIMQHPFRMLGFLLMMGQRATASAQRILEIIDAEPEVVDSPQAVDLPTCLGDVEFGNVWFGYAAGPDLLRGFSLTLRPGETVALVGRSGCGKSTVARLLNRFYDVRSGAIRIDGHDVRDITLSSLHRHVGVVPDEAFLFSTTIHENVAYARPDASRREVRAALEAAGAMEFVDRLPKGMEAVVGERGYTLSGGQRQRLALARALLLNPPVLVLDDATSALDVQIEEQVHAALVDLLAERTTLVIAHRLSTIAMADRVVLMEDGRVVADGQHAELLESTPAYAELLMHIEEDWAKRHPEPELAEDTDDEDREVGVEPPEFDPLMPGRLG